MPTPTKTAILAATAKIARMYAHGGTPDPQALAAAQRALATAKIAHVITEALSVSPPLTDDQLDQISRLLLRGGVK